MDHINQNITDTKKEIMQENIENENRLLHSEDENLIQSYLVNRLLLVIHNALRVMAITFTPEECADIVQNAFREIANNSESRKDIIAWVKTVKSKRDKF